MDDPRELALHKFDSGAPPITTWLGVIERYATDPPLAIAAILDALRPAAARGARICELGFGSGWLLEETARAFPGPQLFGLDLSTAHIRALDARLGVGAVLGDMERLPYKSGAFNAIVTCWTLYFMRDIDAALAGMKECLAPGGVFVAATTAPDHMREFEELVARALEAVGVVPEVDVAARFDTVTGAPYVRRVFPDAELREWRGTLTVPDAAPLLVLWPGYGPQSLPPDVDAAARQEFRRLATEHIAKRGSLAITRHDGAFVGTKDRD